jgi:hypothetical protein
MTKSDKSGKRTRIGALPGIRWIPVPLAFLVAVVGWLVYGTVLGQSAAAQADHHGNTAGGLQIAVQQMGWMSNDMTGNGPVAVPSGFPMDPAMMPGMQPSNDNRLQLEVTLRNVTPSIQTYHMSEFKVIGPGGQSWPELSTAGQNTYATQGAIEPNFNVTLAVYFDIPMKSSKGLSIEWSRGGTTVDIPVDLDGPSMGPMNMS